MKKRTMEKEHQAEEVRRKNGHISGSYFLEVPAKMQLQESYKRRDSASTCKPAVSFYPSYEAADAATASVTRNRTAVASTVFSSI